MKAVLGLKFAGLIQDFLKPFAGVFLGVKDSSKDCFWSLRETQLK